MIRKVIVIAFAIIALSAAPAAAQYSEVEGTGATSGSGGTSSSGSGSSSGSLAETGSDVVVLVPLAAGLIAAGGLALFLVRRRTEASALST